MLAVLAGGVAAALTACTDRSPEAGVNPLVRGFAGSPRTHPEIAGVFGGSATIDPGTKRETKAIERRGKPK